MENDKHTNEMKPITFKECPLLIQIDSQLVYENMHLKQVVSEVINTINKIEEPDTSDIESTEYMLKWCDTLETALSDIETTTKLYFNSNIGTINNRTAT